MCYSLVMKITVKCFATLAQYAPSEQGHLEVEAGTTISELIAILGLPVEDVKIIFLNGAHAIADTVLSSGDRVGFFPAVGGG